METADAGRSWAAHRILSPGTAYPVFYRIACPSANLCLESCGGPGSTHRTSGVAALVPARAGR